MIRKQLSLRQKVGQLMVVGFAGTVPTDEVLGLIREDHVGSIILFGRNIGTAEEVLKLNIELQKAAFESGHSIPLLISIDQENGIVRRLGPGTTLFPGQMTLGAADSEELTERMCQASGLELKSLGINWNLAPVLDVNNNPKNPVIGVRSFGEDPELVSRHGLAAIRGYRSGGVMTCVKHFPGHGDTDLDSHYTLPTISHDRHRLESVEFVPFRAAIEAGVDSIMIAHVCFPAIEPEPGVPATLSHRVVTGLLREEFGYEGVITTDCLEMNAISETVGTPEGALAALKAGVDLLMVSHRPEWQKEAIERIVKAVEKGEITEERIDQSLERIRKMKEKYLNWEQWIPLFESGVNVPEAVGCPEHDRLAREIAERGVTVVKAEQLPFAPEENQQVLVVYPRNLKPMAVEDRRYLQDPLATAVKSLHSNVVAIEIQSPPKESDWQRVIEAAQLTDYIIVGTLEASRYDAQIELVKALHAAGKPMAVLAMRGPYDIAEFPEVKNYIATYEFTPVCVETAAAALFGKTSPTGRLPVTIPGVANRGWRFGG